MLRWIHIHQKTLKKRKKVQFIAKTIQKDDFCYNVENKTHIAIWDKFYTEEKHTNTKTNKK